MQLHAWNISLLTVMNIHEHSIYLRVLRDLKWVVFVKLYVQFFFVGLGPRKFRTTKSDTGDRSVWTDTPADRLKRAQVVGDSFMTKMYIDIACILMRVRLTFTSML